MALFKASGILLTTEAKDEFLDLYREHHQALEQFCRVLCRDREAARELVQESLLQAFQGYHRLREAEKFRSWLLGIAVRVKRSKDRKQLRWILPETLPEPEASEQSDAEASLSILRSLCGKLRKSEREVFLLFELSDLPLQEIADLQHTNVNTVKTRLRRAREKLRSWLEQENRSIEIRSGWTPYSLSMEGRKND